MTSATGWSQAWSRRQFLARGGAAAGALALAGLLPQRASADAPGSLTSEELAVLGALASAILIAADKPPGELSALGLQSPQAVAQGFGALDPESRSAIAAVLDAIDGAPSRGTFVSLSDRERQAAIRAVLVPLRPPAASAAEVQALMAFFQEASAAYPSVLAQIEAGTVPDEVAEPSGPEAPDMPPGPLQTFPPTPPPSPELLLAETMLAGLELVATPLTAPPPPPPPPPPLSPTLVASLIEAALTSVPGKELPQGLIDQLASGTDASELEITEIQPLPAPVLEKALATWLLAPSMKP